MPVPGNAVIYARGSPEISARASLLLRDHRSRVSRMRPQSTHRALAAPQAVPQPQSRTPPANHREAMASPEAAHWRAAEDREIASQLANRTYDVVPRPARGAPVVRSRWVYKYKFDAAGRVVGYKARWVIC